MALFDDASLVTTPNGYKEGTLYSIKPTSGLGDMTVVRATTATRVNSAGLIELVPYNLLTYSEQLNNAIWEKSDTTITANSTTAPNGTLTADRMFETSTTALHGVYQEKTLITGTNYSISCYVKKGNRRYCGLQMFYNITRGSLAFFDLDNGTLVYEYAEGGYTITNSNITNVGNGWYRLEAIISVDLPTAYFGLVMASTQWTTGTAYDNLYLGDVTKYVDSWGFQLVAGTLPKDYLRTETRLNIPRLDYSNGSCPSLLVEPQRTNLVLYSEQFDNAGWGKSGVTITANNTTSPDGTSNADLVTTTNATSHELLQSKIVTGVHTCSFYVKKNNSQTFYINMYSNGWTAYFNLNNGTVSSVVGSGVTANVTNAGNGWYRCSITFTSVGSEIQLGFLDTVYTGVAGNPWTIPTSVGTSGWVWGAQLEAGAYATSYIPTTSAAVTRNADVISKTGISSLIGQTEGTLFFEGYFNDVQTGTVFLDLEGTSPKINLQIGSGILYFYSQGEWSMSTAISLNTKYKIAGAYKNNDIAFYVNGVLIATDNSATITAKSNFYLNSEGGSYVADLDINLAVLFPTRLTNAELAQLTTI